MLVTADIAKSDTADLPTYHTLQIAGSTPSTENRDKISTSPDEANRSFGDHKPVFIRTRLDKNLVIGLGLK